MDFKTADLCDDHAATLQIAEPLFQNYGSRAYFSGPMVTLKLHEDNALVRAALEEPGEGRVLVVDGGGSLRCALLGDQLAKIAETNGWSGVLVYGAIRDSADVAKCAIGVKALATHPLKSVKRGQGERGAPLRFAGVSFYPGHYLYSDEDGIVVSEKPLV